MPAGGAAVERCRRAAGRIILCGEFDALPEYGVDGRAVRQRAWAGKAQTCPVAFGHQGLRVRDDAPGGRWLGRPSCYTAQALQKEGLQQGLWPASVCPEAVRDYLFWGQRVRLESFTGRGVCVLHAGRCACSQAKTGIRSGACGRCAVPDKAGGCP